MKHIVHHLQEQLRQGKIGRRDFLRLALKAGVSLAAAEVLAACASQPPAGPGTTEPIQAATAGVGTPAVPTGTPVATAQPTRTLYPTLVPLIQDMDGDVPTPSMQPTAFYRTTPGPTWGPRTPTRVPTWSQGATWSCPGCQERFPVLEDMLQHYSTNHARKMPGIRKVAQPTYAQFVRKVERFDQKDIVFMRLVWDEDYQKLLPYDSPWRRHATEAEAQEGMARMAGAIYADDKAGSFHPDYYGYFGHLQGVDGLYSWDEPVNPLKYQITNPARMSDQVKLMARFYGADLVGICEIHENWVYSHYFDRETGAYGELEIPYKYAVVMAVEMPWEHGIKESPDFPSSAATALAYSNMAEVSSKLAQYIRVLGYEAVPSGNDTTQSIPLAIDAGLGELGRHGLLITPEFGPRVRICKVYTNIPLQPDQPIDFGLQSFCEQCRFCAANCPVQAVPDGDRFTGQTSISNRPGILRWTVDVGKCYLFWASNVAGSQRWNDCANCVRACPWSAPVRSWL